jgi:hypothetical protein
MTLHGSDQVDGDRDQGGGGQNSPKPPLSSEIKHVRTRFACIVSLVISGLGASSTHALTYKEWANTSEAFKEGYMHALYDDQTGLVPPGERGQKVLEAYQSCLEGSSMARDASPRDVGAAHGRLSNVRRTVQAGPGQGSGALAGPRQNCFCETRH